MSLTYSQIPVPDLYASILAGSCYEVSISTVCARGRDDFFTLHCPWFKHTSLLLWIFNFPRPHSPKKNKEIFMYQRERSSKYKRAHKDPPTFKHIFNNYFKIKCAL